MASKIVYELSLLSCLILFASLFQTSSADDKVPVGIYYQAKNAKYFSEILSEFIPGKMLPIMNLHLVPWGNSKLLSNGSFECQFGEEECYLDTIQACAIDVWHDVETHFKFILCVEESWYEKSDWKTCYNTLGLDPKPIDECYNSGRGKELEKQYAKETAALDPPHTFTPWVVVEGKPLEYDALDVVRIICKAYKGSSPPEICKKFPPITSSSNKAVKFQVRRDENLAKPAMFTRSKLI